MINEYLETKKATTFQLKQYVRNKNKNPKCLLLGIFLKKKQNHIGNIKLEPIDFKNKKATLGILIGDKIYWGRGIGAEAIKLILNYAFSKLNLKEVNLGVISKNKRAITLFKKIGFKIDLIEKKSIRYNNELFDRLIMSIKQKSK